MNPYQHSTQQAVFVGNDIFWKASPSYRCNDAAYLLPGQTEWFGPMPLDGEEAKWLRKHYDDAVSRAKAAAVTGTHLHVQKVGAYIRTHRLRTGPAKKLSDWKQLPCDVQMLLHPYPSPADIEKALTRVRYMQDRGYGHFRSWTDDAGALWVERR